MFIANQIPCWQQEEPLTVVGNSGLGDERVVQVKFAPAACRYKMILVLLRVSIILFPKNTVRLRSRDGGDGFP